MIYLRNAKTAIVAFCRSFNKNATLIEAEESSVGNLNLYNNLLFSGQQEIIRVKDLSDQYAFEQVETETQYVVDSPRRILGQPAHDLGEGPLNMGLNIQKKGGLQLRLLMLNGSEVPKKVIIRYDGIEQEFWIDWKEWGWAPVTLLKQYDKNKKVDFQILAENKANLQVARACLVYQDEGITD